MIRVTLPTGRTVGFSFAHPTGVTSDARGDERPQRQTTCSLAQLEHDTTLNTEMGTLLASIRIGCHYKDQFSKEKGRKLSLGAALKAARLNKAERTAVWNAYRNRGRA